MRLIDAEQIVTMELFDDEHEEYYKKKISIEDMIATYTTEMELPTIDAIPVEWIKKRIEGLNIQAENSTDDNKWADFAREAFALEKIVKFWAERK